MACLGVPVGGRVRKLRVVGDHEATFPEREEVTNNRNGLVASHPSTRDYRAARAAASSSGMG